MFTQKNMKELTENQKKWLDIARDLSMKKAKGQFQLPGTQKSCCIIGCGIVGLYGFDFKGSLDFHSEESPLKQLGLTRHGYFETPIEIDGQEFLGLTSLNDHTDLTLPELADIVEQEICSGNLL